MSNNLADATQVKKAELKEKDLRKQELNDVRTVLSNASGRRFAWRLMSLCKSYNSVFVEDANRMSYLAGKQDLGHFIMSEIVEADENLLLKMMKDNYKAKGAIDGN